MRRRELERKLNRVGWRLERHGGSHDIWSDGHRTLIIPRHREIDNQLAKAILRSAELAGADRSKRE